MARPRTTTTTKKEKGTTSAGGGGTPELVPVVATINLPDLPRGSRVLVDPTRRYISEALRAGYLVRLPEQG